MKRSTRLTLRRARGADEWNAQLGRPGATPFHSWEWLHLVAPLVPGRAYPLVAVRRGEVVGLVPVLLSRHGALTKANVVPFQYLGPLADPDDLLDIARVLRGWAWRRGVPEVQLMFHPDAGVAPGALTGAGYRERRDTTFVVPLAGRSEDEVFAGLGKNVRNAVRRAARHGVEVRPSTPSELSDVLPRLSREALGYELPVVPALGARLAAGPVAVPVTTRTAVLDDRPVGVVVMVHGGTTIGWLGGVFRADQPSGAYTSLMWASLQAALEAGDESFDLLAAPDEGIAHYKRGLRPVERTYGEWTWTFGPLRVARRLRKERS